MFKKKTGALEMENIPEQGAKKKKNKNSKVVTRVVIGGVIVLVVALLLVPRLMPKNSTPFVSVMAVKKGDVEENLSTTGIVQSEKTQTYYSPTSATITDFTPVVGNVIHSGDELVKFDTADLENQYEQAKLANTASQAGYHKSVTQSQDNTTKYQNAATDVDVLNQQVTDAQNNVNNLQIAINSASNDLAKKQTSLADLQAALTSIKDADKLKNQNDKINTTKKAIKDLQNHITDLNNQLITAQADYGNLQSDLAKREADKTTADASKLTADDKKQLAANTEVTALTADLAKANLEAAQKGVVAEFDGVVTATTGENGALAAKGTPLFTVASNKDVKLNVSITKYDLDKVKEGQSAEIKLAQSTYKGTVTKVNRVATENTKPNASTASVITVEVHIDNPDDNIYLGVEADVTIKEATATGVLLIPVEAINTDSNGGFCYVVENNIVVKKAITTGVTSDTVAEVKEGLTEGAQVITNVTADIKEGIKVNPMIEQ